MCQVHLRTYLRHEQELNVSSTELFCCAQLVLQLSYRTNADAKATCQSAIQGAPCHPMPCAQLIGVCSMLENNKRRPIPPKRLPMLETSHQLNEKRGSFHRRVRHKHETAHQSEEKRSDQYNEMKTGRLPDAYQPSAEPLQRKKKKAPPQTDRETAITPASHRTNTTNAPRTPHTNPARRRFFFIRASSLF